MAFRPVTGEPPPRLRDMVAARQRGNVRSSTLQSARPPGQDLRQSRPVTATPVVKSGLFRRLRDRRSTKRKLKPKKVAKAMAIGTIISTGAGLLAKGVKSLFGEDARARRAARRAERKAQKEGASPKEAASVAEMVAEEVLGKKEIPGIPQAPATAGAMYGKRADQRKIGEMIQKYWWVWLIILFFLGGGMKMLNPPRRRRSPRRRAAAPARRRRSPARRRAPARKRRR